MSEVLVQVEGVRKKFCRSLRRSLWYGMHDMLGEVFRGSASHDHLRHDEFWAVDNVSFELRRGECLGLIGRNGAGKTTLLKMLNGLIKPDHGRITMRGRIGALIALGAGFNPILTGRENIYVNASVLGLTKRETDAQIDEIIDFAEVREFIDSPVQSYSSGMQVRLGFAIATALEPDVLLLDEVLAVGDAAFRNKCYNRIGHLRHRSAVIFVSHSMDQISMICDLAIVLRKAKPEYIGQVSEGIRCYESLNEALSEGETKSFETMQPPIRSFSCELDRSVQYGDYLPIRITVESDDFVPNAILRVVFYNPMHSLFAEWNSRRIGQPIDINSGSNEIAIQVGPLAFKSADYPLGIVLSDSTGANLLVWSFKQHRVSVDGFTQVGPDVALGAPAPVG